MTNEQIIEQLEADIAQLERHLDDIMDYVRVERLLSNRHEQIREFYRKVGDLAIRAAGRP